MRMAVLADIHGNLAALEAVLADMALQAIDHAIDLGDCVSGPLWPRETMAQLQTLGLPTLRGNHDREVGEGDVARLSRTDRFAFESLDAEDRAHLLGLPLTLRLFDRITAFHASPINDLLYVLDDIVEGRLVRAAFDEIEARIGATPGPLLLMGHSHRADMVQLADGRVLLNPGSVGYPAYDDPAGPDNAYGAHVSEAGSPHARYAILELHPDFRLVRVDFRAIAYDFERAAARAAGNGRPDWAYALRTGRVLPSGA